MRNIKFDFILHFIARQAQGNVKKTKQTKTLQHGINRVIEKAALNKT